LEVVKIRDVCHGMRKVMWLIEYYNENYFLNVYVVVVMFASTIYLYPLIF